MTTNKYNETEELLGFNTVWKDFCRAKFHKYDEQTNNLQKYNINNIWSKNISNKLYRTHEYFGFCTSWKENRVG